MSRRVRMSLRFEISGARRQRANHDDGVNSGGRKLSPPVSASCLSPYSGAAAPAARRFDLACSVVKYELPKSRGAHRDVYCP